MVNSSGLFGFFFIDVGKELSFTTHRKATDSEETYTITESKTFSNYMSQFTDSSKLSWNRRLVNKNDKYLTLTFASLFIHEKEGGELSEIISKLVKAKGLPESLLENSDFKDIFDRFQRSFSLNFNPTASVIGAIVSQEVVKAVTQRDYPSHGLAVYDSITERCLFE